MLVLEGFERAICGVTASMVDEAADAASRPRVHDV
jgi:hypothetical protein